MSETHFVQDNQKYIWKKVFIILSIVIVILMPLLSRDYGQSGDEWLEMEYGRDVYDYFFNDGKQALDYTNRSLQYSGMHMYGGLFDYYTEIAHRLFPSVPILTLKHFFNALFGAVMMVFTGLIARRLSKKWSIGTLALLFIFFSPRIFGESMNNPKDIPHACGYAIAIYGLVALLQDVNKRFWWHCLLIGIGFGVTFGIRPPGGILQACYMLFFIGLYYILNKDFKAQLQAENKKLFKKMALGVGGALLLGFIIGLSAWPYGFESPIAHTLESITGLTNRDVVLRVMFEGLYQYSNNLPWYYEFKWICISNPVVVLVGVAMFIALIIPAIRHYSLFTVILVLFCAFFPLLYMIYKNSTVYDTWRHVFFVYIFWVVAGALGWDLISTFIKNEKLKILPVAIAILGLIPAITWTVRSHPNQYVYFNEFQGGVQGAFGYYDLDYYQNTGKQAADWILKNAKRVPGRKLIVLSNMQGFNNYFAKDSSWISYDYARYGDRHKKEWDYYVTYGRFISPEQLQANNWPPKEAVHIIAIDETPLSAILYKEDKNKLGVEANKALEARDFATAVTKYTEYIKKDASDESVFVSYAIALASTGQLEPSIAALKRATEIDPADPNNFRILAQLYQFKNDMANAQNAIIRAQELELRDKDLQKPAPPQQ
jgi:tetratricopeptide (TPR) repeat protein